MRRLATPLWIAATVPLVCTVMYLAAPLLRGAQAAVNAEVDEHVERARRMLHQYDPSAERLSELLQSLSALDVDVTPSGEKVDRLLEEYRSVLEAAEETLKARARQTRATQDELEDRYRAAGGTKAAASQPPGFGVNVAAMAAAMRQGLSTRDDLLARNERLVQDALTEISEGLATTVSDAEGAHHPLAQRLKGLLLRFRAAVLQRSAWRTRSRGDDARYALADLLVRARQLQIEKGLVEQSQVRRQIDALHQDADALRQKVDDRRTRLAKLDETIADLQQRIDSHRKIAEPARRKMETLQDEGANLLAPDGYDAFAVEYARASVDYRNAVAEAHRLEFGTLQNARIDDSGDYILGQFVPADPDRPVVVLRGLAGYRNDRDTLAGELKGLDETLSGVEADAGSLEQLAQGYAAHASEAGAEFDEMRSRAASLYTELETHLSGADAEVDQAVNTLNQAVAALKLALDRVSERNRNAKDVISKLSPDARDRSPNRFRSEDTWLTGQINNDLGQINYLLGSILYDRFAGAAEDYELALRIREALELSDIGPDFFAARRDAAREKGLAALRDAISFFERSSRDLDRHWTLAAQVGDAHFLLSRFESDPYPYILSAIENLTQAVTNRENKPFTQTIRTRLKQLQAR
ncbi:MAG: hypothetical protein IID39_01065 [Planctomycetes bacterium]|nr:hypothetical protein [Planctomycetota bacterium]